MRSRCSDAEMSRICCIDLTAATMPRVVSDWPVRGVCHMRCGLSGAPAALSVWSLLHGAAEVAVARHDLQDLGLHSSSSDAGDLDEATGKAAEAGVSPSRSGQWASQAAAHALCSSVAAQGHGADDVSQSSCGQLRRQGSNGSCAGGGTLSLRAATRQAQASLGACSTPAAAEDAAADDASERLRLADLLGISDGSASPQSSAEAAVRGTNAAPLTAGREACDQGVRRAHDVSAARPDTAAVDPVEAGTGSPGDGLSWDAFRSVREQLEAMCSGDDDADDAPGSRVPLCDGSPRATVTDHSSERAAAGVSSPGAGGPGAERWSGAADIREETEPRGRIVPVALPTADVVEGASDHECAPSDGSASLCNSSLFNEGISAQAQSGAAPDHGGCSPSATHLSESSLAEAALELDFWLANADEATAAVRRAASAAADREPFALSQLCAVASTPRSPDLPVAPQRSSNGGVAWSIGEALPGTTRVYGRSPGFMDHASPAVAAAAPRPSHGPPAADSDGVQRQRRPTSQALLRRLMRKKPTVRQILGKDPPAPPPGRRLPVRTPLPPAHP